jgi:urease gamma subunit
MPIRPFLDGEFFGPELIETMGQALADTCTALGLKDKDDAAVRLLAARIVNKARQGVHDRDLLKAAALEGLRPARKQ